MGRIRLQVCVLPWDQPCSSSSTNAQARHEVKWCEPCTEDTPMQVACDRIYKSWQRMFAETMGPLKIRHLKTSYGDFLDLQERVVGDFFDDRGADGNIRNSILEVHRYPPAPDQLESLQRFSSLAPNSSVRPRKRPLELPSHSYPSQFSQNTHREIPSIEGWDAEATTSSMTETKRQRTHESRLNRTYAGHQNSTVREEHSGKPFQPSQTAGTQESIHQVLDSQMAPGKKHPNPYGTPTSLTLLGLQKSNPSSEIDLSAIPDSPLGKETLLTRGAFVGALQTGRESTRSESPELGASVDGASPTHPINASGNASGEQSIASANSPKASSIPSIFNSASQPVPVSQNVDQYPKNHGLGAPRNTSENVSDANQTPKHSSSTADLAHVQDVQIHSNTQRESDPLYDPIESDTESFHEKQQMQSAKRLRSSKTPTATVSSLRESNRKGLNRRDGPFIVPAVPQLPMNGVRKPQCEGTSLGQRKNLLMPTREFKDVNASCPDDPKRPGNTLEHAQSNGYTNEFDLAAKAPKRNIACSKPVDATQNSSQATTALSQGSNSTSNGTTKSVVQQDNTVSSQENSGEKESAGEALERRNAANREAIERRTKENMIPDRRGANEDKFKAKESTQVTKARARGAELADAKQTEETRVNEARLLEGKKTSARLAREQQIREASLAAEANRAMLAADGAKLIEAEKQEKEKARLEELADKRKANEAKAREQAREAQSRDQGDRDKKIREERRARERAQKLADTERDDAEGEAPPRRTDLETARAVREQAQRSIAAREAQRLRGSSEAQSRASTNPLTYSISADPSRSMTPRIPGPSVPNSSPLLTSLRSSPLSNQVAGSTGAPLRSALRQTSSALRRSASFVSFGVLSQTKPNDHIAPPPNPKSPKEINKNFPTKSSSATNLPISSPAIISNPPSKTPMKSLAPKKKKISDGKMTKTPAKKNGKVQTKLNVKREPKKLKDRADAPPTKLIQAPNEVTVISSGEELSTSEEPVWQTGNAEAGPSSRKPTLPAVSKTIKTVEVKLSAARLDPSLRNIKVEKDRTAALAPPPRTTSTSDTTSLHESTSRSPALTLSQTISLSSGSASSIASEAESKPAPKAELQVPPSKTPTGTESGTRAPFSVKGVSKSSNVVARQPADQLKGNGSSQSSNHVSTSQPRSNNSTKSDGEQINQAASRQLQSESRSSIPSTRIGQTSSNTDNAVGDKAINQGLSHAGRLPNGIDPAYHTFSELQKQARAVTPETEPRLNTFSSHTSPASTSESEDSSDSDKSSSQSDGDKVVDGPPSQIRPWKPFPGVKRLVEVSRRFK